MSAANPLRQLNASGQSIWYDNIHRAMLGTDLQKLIDDDDLRGITSNPSIFERAITTSSDYDEALRQTLTNHPQYDSRELFFSLAIADIQAAADQLHPTYQATDGVDGMVSLEVSPDLAHDCDATIREARALHAQLQRPNVMIKVPATKACLPAIEQLTADGININVTLLFAVDRYQAVAEAYINGLQQRLARQQSVNGIASVASFFISRTDAALDEQLAQSQRPDLQGKIAIANAKLAYQAFQEIFHGTVFAELKAAGARAQRLLWASSATKNPAYSDVLYVEELIGPETVNTLPPVTYDAFRDHGTVAMTLEQGMQEAAEQIQALAELGIDLAAVTDMLEEQGVTLFADSFTNLLNAIDAKTAQLAA